MRRRGQTDQQCRQSQALNARRKEDRHDEHSAQQQRELAGDDNVDAAPDQRAGDPVASYTAEVCQRSPFFCWADNRRDAGMLSILFATGNWERR
jgi:hypothetical protein